MIFLAPDSLNEMVNSLTLFKKYTGKAYALKFEQKKKYSEEDLITLGKQLLEGRNRWWKNLKSSLTDLKTANEK